MIFNDEVMLLGWRDTHTQGATVTFQLADSSMLDAFKAITVAKGKMAGQRLAMCLVEIGDDEKPVEKEKLKGGARSIWLALRCKEPAFWRFIESVFDITHECIKSEAECDKDIKHHLSFDSKADLDNSFGLAERFDHLIREPYSKWIALNGEIN